MRGKRNPTGTPTRLRSSASLSLASISSTLAGAPPPRAPSISLILIRRGGALAADAIGPSSAGISIATGSRVTSLPIITSTRPNASNRGCVFPLSPPPRRFTLPLCLSLSLLFPLALVCSVMANHSRGEPLIWNGVVPMALSGCQTDGRRSRGRGVSVIT
jgi:hypothetical protein